MSEKSGLVFDIHHFSVHDGPGIRTTVFLKGCPLSCAWCHNPESQLFEPEACVRIRRIDDKEFPITETIGKPMSVEEVMGEVTKDIPIFDESNGGVTFSGGEPLSQHDFLKAMLIACKSKEIHSAVDTSGYAAKTGVESIIPYASLFLYDLKLANDEEHRKYTGVSNKPILENLDLIIKSRKKVVIRIPLIQDITDTDNNLKALRDIIRKYSGIQRVDLLPFHNIAKSKYERFGKEYRLGNADAYDRVKAEQISDYFKEMIPVVTLGG